MQELGSDAKVLRFGDGKGIAGNFMIVDFFSLKGATNACTTLHGSRAFGNRLTCELTQATKSGLSSKNGVKPEAARQGVVQSAEQVVSRLSVDLSCYTIVDGVVVYDLEKIGWGMTRNTGSLDPGKVVVSHSP